MTHLVIIEAGDFGITQSMSSQLEEVVSKLTNEWKSIGIGEYEVNVISNIGLSKRLATRQTKEKIHINDFSLVNKGLKEMKF